MTQRRAAAEAQGAGLDTGVLGTLRRQRDRARIPAGPPRGGPHRRDLQHHRRRPDRPPQTSRAEALLPPPEAALRPVRRCVSVVRKAGRARWALARPHPPTEPRSDPLPSRLAHPLPRPAVPSLGVRGAARTGGWKGPGAASRGFLNRGVPPVSSCSGPVPAPGACGVRQAPARARWLSAGALPLGPDAPSLPPCAGDRLPGTSGRQLAPAWPAGVRPPHSLTPLWFLIWDCDKIHKTQNSSS